jgi:hypothetical protein
VKIGEIVEMVRQAQLLREELERDWIENVQFLMGRFGSKTEFEDMDRVDVNMAWANLMAIIPTLYWRNPRVLAKAKRPQDILKAPCLEAGIQHWIGKIGTQRVTQRTIIDAHCFPFGLNKLGYRVKDVQVAVKVSRVDGSAEVVDESEEVDLSEFDVEQRTMAIGERPVLKRVSLLSAWIDPLCADFEESEWLVEEVVRDVKEVRQDPKYKNTSKLQATGAVNDIFATQNTPQRSMPRVSESQGPYAAPSLAKVRSGQVVLWEFWHKTERKLYVIVPDQNVLLREDDWPYPFFPYKALQLGVPVPDTPYPTPPNSVWKAQQRELNKIRTYTLDHIKRAIPKFLVDSAKLSRSAQQELKEGVMQVVMVDGDPTQMVQQMPGAPVNADVWRSEATIKTDIQQITGIADFQRAGAAPEGTTATEVRAIASSTSARIDYQRFQVSELVRWIAVGIHKLLRVYWDTPEWIRVTGRSDWQYQKLDAEALDGEFEIEIDVGSQLPPDKATEKKTALDNFSILAPIAVQRPDLLRFDELVRYLMEKLEVPDPDRFLQTDDANRPPSNVQDEEILLREGGMPTFSPNDDQPGHILGHTEGLQQATDDQDRWRRLMHLNKHVQYEQQQMMAAQMAQSQMLQQVAQAAGGAPGGAGPSGPVPPNVVPLQGGQGRGQPAPGFPMNPRMFGQDAPNPTTQARADSRRLRS